MEASVVAGVESGVEFEVGTDANAAALQLRLLGPMAIHRAGVAQALPPSRKVRGLVAYLALAQRAPARGSLCELLWDLPNDPRGELRWTLSKARALLDEPGRARLLTEGDTIRIDLSDAAVDALAVERALRPGVATLAPERLRALASLFGGDFLQGLEIERSAPFSAWLIAQRRRFRALHAAILEQLAQRLPPEAEELIPCVEAWLRLAPFDRRAHALLLDALARRGLLREGEEHLAATARLFEAEAQDWAPIGHAWRAARSGLAAAVEPVAPGASPLVLLEAGAPTAATRRASIAVMPFADHTRNVAMRGGLADGLAHDVTTRLAKLRSLFVIAQGTVFALDERSIGAEEAGRTLGVDYVAGGSLRRGADGKVSVSVQLSETRSARIVWAESFTAPLGDALAVLDEIGNRIVSAIANQIEVAERNRAILKAPNSLDAWEAHHRGLWHMVRFDREDNESARHFFETAVRLDPGFSRPYAGLSFTHFQNAFLGWGERDAHIELAWRAAAQGLMADDRDPAAHWAMGRALWLRGQEADALAELDCAVDLSPNFALGHYTRAFVHGQSGDARIAIEASDYSRELSPFDPMLFAMMATRSIALLRLERYDEAADWALKASARPNAHVHALAIAVSCLVLAERVDEARAIAATIQRRVPGYRIDDLMKVGRFAPEAAARMRRAAQRVGMG
ncbi:transcriptional regulator [Rivibacter subsaxonicus]|uniref:TolB-like protein n=1 Tax=Rivibacter subsaxonicus TaxID=457575 RepID=A0A4Q7VZF0_9BURK|nr:transcriptional regulator [Rivibacter subsaxonicus]RZU02241.1 TolB-like protein [Rivibacter subsaxonicus]